MPKEATTRDPVTVNGEIVRGRDSTSMSEIFQQDDENKFSGVIPSEPTEVCDDKYATFVKWLQDNNAIFPKLELRDYGNEVRGCHSVTNIEEEEVIIQIPLKCLITVEMGRDTPIGRKIINSNIELDAPKHLFLMLFLLIDCKNPDSFFKPYYDILPQSLSNMPIFWTEDELGFLEGSYMIQQIKERSAAIENDYFSILSVVPEIALYCNLEKFKWARMCVCSRNFGLIVNGLRTAALVPYADMLNHYRPRETKWQFDDSIQGFTITSLQQIHTGAQVYDSYGQKCNHRFLLNYGFSIDDNSEPDGFCPNEVPILLSLYETDNLYGRKCDLNSKEPCFPNRRLRICVSDNESTRLMFAMLRIIVADGKDMDQIFSSSGSYKAIRDAQIAVNIVNELKALELLKSTCENLLNAYPATLLDDERKLRSQDIAPFSNQRHAIIQVKGEKIVLHHYIDLATTAIDLIKAPDNKVFEDMMSDIKNTKNSLLIQYCRTTIGRLRLESSKKNESSRMKFLW